MTVDNDLCEVSSQKTIAKCPQYGSRSALVRVEEYKLEIRPASTFKKVFLLFSKSIYNNTLVYKKQNFASKVEL